MITALTALLLAARLAGAPALESLSEDLYDHAADAAAARALLKKVTKATRAIGPQEAPAALRQEAADRLQRLRAAVEGGDVPAVREAANRLCETAVAIRALHEPAQPIAMMRLDVLLRDVQLAGSAGSLDRAQRPLAEVRALWRKVSASPGLAGSPAASAFEEQVTALEGAAASGAAARIEAAVKAALDGVDALEEAARARKDPAKAAP